MAVDEQGVGDFRSEDSNPSIRIVDDFLELTLGHFLIFVNRHLMLTDTNFFTTVCDTVLENCATSGQHTTVWYNMVLVL
jgi:hypothetical protein